MSYSNYIQPVLNYAASIGHFIIRTDASNETFGTNINDQLKGRFKSLATSTFFTLVCAIAIVILFASHHDMVIYCGLGLMGGTALIFLKDTFLQSIALSKEKKLEKQLNNSQI